jgi:hypothetical protein
MPACDYDRDRIDSETVISSVDSFEVIEEYPTDKYLPSYLIRGEGRAVFHVHVATDVGGNNIRIMTTYLPNPDEWDSGFRTRRSDQ